MPDAPFVIGNPQSTFLLLSLDGTGRTWKTPFYFHIGTGCSYTSNFEHDGKLHVFYSHSSLGTEPVQSGLPHQAIKRAVISIQRSKGK